MTDVVVNVVERPAAVVRVVEPDVPVVQTLPVPIPVVVVQAFGVHLPPSALDVMSVVAGSALSGHRVVRASAPDEVDVASSANVAHAGLVLGITTGAAIQGDLAHVRIAGELIEPTFAFVPGPVYFNSSGVLTQTPPTSGFIQSVAVALSATKIVVGLGIPILLN
jgi:hypothetical protein